MLYLMLSLMTSACQAIGGSASVASDTAALAAAIQHVRNVVPEGRVQVSSDSSTVEPFAALREGSRQMGFSFGPDEEAVHCDAVGLCQFIGEFKGLIHVTDYHRAATDSAVVTLRMLRPKPGQNDFYEQVDEVHVKKAEENARWRIVAVGRVSES